MREATRLAKIQSLVGTKLEGRYCIDSVIGHGGMGVVYRGRHLLMETPVAIKMILNAEEDCDIPRFKREAQAVSILKHPHIVSVRDFGLSDDGMPYMVMDLVEGVGLDQLIRAGKIRNYKDCLTLMFQLADALNHAHRKGVIHRDLKPGNLLISQSEDGQPFLYVLDFGLAKLLDSDSDEVSRLTKTGAVVGTPHYMSPEQCMGQKLDMRSDIYSAGCILYEMLSGKLAVTGENVLQILYAHTGKTPDPLGPEVPQGLARIVFRTMSKKPEERFQSVAELKSELHRFLEGSQATPHGQAISTPPVVVEHKETVSSTNAASSAVSRVSRKEDKPPELSQTVEYSWDPYNHKPDTEDEWELEAPYRELYDGEQELIDAVNTAENSADGDVAEALFNLALFIVENDNKFNYSERYGQARGLLERALSIVRERGDLKSHWLFRIYDSLGYVCNMLYERKDAAYYYLEAGALGVKAQSPPTMAVAKSFYGAFIALTYTERKDIAATSIVKAIEICEKHWQPSQAEILSEWLCEAGYFKYLKKEEHYYLKSIQVAEQALGPVHGALVLPCLRLAETLWYADRDNEAEPWYRRTINLAYKTLDPYDSLFADAALACGNFYSSQKNLDKAFKCLTKALEIREHNLGAKSHQLAPIMHGLGRYYDRMENYPEAIKYHLRAVELQQGNDDKKTLIDYLLHCGWSFEDNKEIVRAEIHMLRAAEQARTLNPPEERIYGIRKYANFLIRLERFTEAEVILTEIRRLQTSLWGADSLELIDTLTPLVDVYEKIGQFASAEKWRKKLIYLQNK